MKLIKEITEDLEYITENNEDNEPKTYFVEGIIMQSTIKNRNGRVYPKEILMREMTRYNEDYVSKNRAFGELGHPEGPTINLDRVSHMFTELKADGDNVVGRAKIMDTPMGKIVKNFIDDGAQLGISSRGIGSLKRNQKGIVEVQGDFKLATAGDIVSDPSAPAAFINGIMENAEFYYDIASGDWHRTSIIEETIEEIQDEVKKSYSKLTESDMTSLFSKFLDTIR